MNRLTLLKPHTLLPLLLAILASTSHAAIDYSTPGALYQQNFDSLPNAPENVNLGLTPAGWTDDTSTPGPNQHSLPGFYLWHPLTQNEGGANGHQRMRIGAGTSNVGGFMSWGTSGSTERALGMLNSSTMAFPEWTNSYYGARFTNNTGIPLNEFTLSYTGEQWRDGGAADIGSTPQLIWFEYKVTSGPAAIQDTGFTPVPLLDFFSPTFGAVSGIALDGNAPANRVEFSPVTTSGFIWSPGDDLWIRWKDPNEPGADHGMGIDDLMFTAIQHNLPQFSIFKWEYIDPNDRSLGKQQSSLLASDGYGLHAAPGLQAAVANLSDAYLIGADLTDAVFNSANLTRAALDHSNLTGGSLNFANLTRANLSQANLSGANLDGANLTGADLSETSLTNAIIRHANLASTHVTLNQLYSTASYLSRDLPGIHFVGNDLSDANFAGQTLTGAEFYAAKLTGANFTNANLTTAELVNSDLSQANLTGANLSLGSLALANLSGANLTNANLSGTNLIGTNLAGADIRGASLGRLIIPGVNLGNAGKYHACGYVWFPESQASIAGSGVTLAQLATTANYGARDLSNVRFENNNFDGGNFAGFNLTNSNFNGTTVVGADFAGADSRGATGLSVFGATNFIYPNGLILGLNLTGGQSLTIRDYDGTPSSGTIPIQVEEQLTMAPGATLQIIFDTDPWDSTISFAAGIPVALGGSLELLFAGGTDLASQIGRTFDLFNWTGVSPTGALTVSSPYVWDLSNLDTTGEVVFLAASGLPGDFNHDNVVDGADYVVWRKELGTQEAYNVWRRNFGAVFGGGSRSGDVAGPPPSVPEPETLLLLIAGLAAACMTRRKRMARRFATSLGSVGRLPLVISLLVAVGNRSLADPPSIQLARIGSPIWKPVDFQLFSAPATPFDQEYGQVYGTLLPHDTPLATTYVPHAPPYDAELSAGMIAGGYVSQSVFTPDAITLQPNGVYFAYMLVPDPGIAGSSRDFATGPVIPNSLFPLAKNVDVWLDGVLVDRAGGADAIIPVQPRDVAFQGTSHLESLQAIWHPWDDDLTVGPLGNYDLRVSIRDVGGSGWDVVAPFQVVPDLPGDFNHDGAVDSADYVVWRKGLGTIYTQNDFNTWRANFGATLGGGASTSTDESTSANVPEPTLAILMLSATSLLLLTRRRPFSKTGILILTNRR